MGDIGGGIVNAGLKWLFDQFGDWVGKWIYDGIAKAVEETMKLTTVAANNFWDSPAVELLLNFSGWINMVVLVISLVFLCMDIAEQAGRVSWSIVFTNFCKGMIFVAFNRYAGLMVYQLAISTTSALRLDTNPPKLSSILDAFTDASMIITALVALVVAIAFVAFFCMAMIRNGTMFVQIFTSSFYISDIIRGDTAKMGEWFKQTVAIAATYFMQYLLFYMGLNNILGSSEHMLVNVATCWLTMFFVPKILDRFGYTSGAGSVFSAAGSVAGAGLSVMR